MPSPLGHGLAGALIAQRVSGSFQLRWVRLYLSCAFWAMLPDADFLLMFLGLPREVAHRTVTHSLTFVFVVSLVAWLIKRQRKAVFSVSLLAVCLLSHLFLDYMSYDYLPPQGIMLFWPFSSEFMQSGLPLFSKLHGENFEIYSFSYYFKAMLKELITVTLLPDWFHQSAQSLFFVLD